MKILVLSDSHSSLRNMLNFVDLVKPDLLIHLGDYYEDGSVLAQEYPGIPLVQVPGNCDRFRCPPHVSEILVERRFGVDLYLTHGHRHGVKQTMGLLLRDARACKVQAVLYGHTHIADCYQEEDGLWVLNPGSCGYSDGTAGLIEIRDKKITACRILRLADLEDTL